MQCSSVASVASSLVVTSSSAFASRPCAVRVASAVAAGAGAGDGSPERPYHGITDAEAAAQPGDTLLLHKGDYGGRIQLMKSGAAHSE